MKNLYYLCIVGTILFLVPYQDRAACAAVLMGADLNDGYAGNVLDAISKHWQAPNDNMQRSVRLQLKIDGRGNFVDCITLSSSGELRIDKSICGVARSIGKYGIPPYAMPAEVYLSFKTGFSGTGNTAMNQMPRQANNNNSGQKNLEQNNLKNDKVQSSSNLSNVVVSNSHIKKSNKKTATMVLPASSSIPTPKNKLSPNMANEELSYDDWDVFGESLNDNMGSIDGNAQAKNISVGNIQIGNAQAVNRSTYTVANRPPVGGRLVDGVWVAGGELANNNITNSIAPNQEEINSGLAYSNQSAIASETVTSRQLTAPPKNSSSRQLTAPSREIASKQLNAEKSNLDADNLYTQAVMQKIAPHIRVPDSMDNGKHTVEMLIEIGTNGVIGQVSVKRISGTHDIDKSIILAIENIKDMPIPPNNKPIRLNINFIVEKV